MKSLLALFLVPALALAQGIPVQETIDFGGKIETKVWQTITDKDGDVYGVPVINGKYPVVSKNVVNGTLYRVYTYPEPTPVLSMPRLVEAVETPKVEVPEPIRRPAPSFKSQPR